jgi:hypothetical protein
VQVDFATSQMACVAVWAVLRKPGVRELLLDVDKLHISAASVARTKVEQAAKLSLRSHHIAIIHFFRITVLCPLTEEDAP